jgi:hypothetical protein
MLMVLMLVLPDGLHVAAMPSAARMHAGRSVPDKEVN